MQLRTEIEILAPRALVWDTIVDFQRYGEWNPFITRISGKLSVGEELSVTISPPESREMSFRPKLLVLSEGNELRWLGKLWLKGLFDGEHFFRLTETPENHTRFMHGEDFSGVLVKFLGQKLTHVARGFVYMNQALKKRVESQRTKV